MVGKLLTGRFKVTLDEKGRIILPASLRKILDDSELTITQCIDEDCLWLFPSSEYNELLNEVLENTNLLSREDRIASGGLFDSFSVDYDKAGRLPINKDYRDAIGLAKDGLVLGRGKYIEIWAEDRYNQFIAANKEQAIAASQKLGETIKKSRRKEAQ